MKCSSIIHLDNTFRAGVQGNFRQPEYGKAINTWVGRTSLLKLMAIPVGIRGQHLEVWQMDCKERTYGCRRVSLQPRAATGRWPGQHQNRDLKSPYFSGSCAWGRTAVSGLPKALERLYEVMNMRAGQALSSRGGQIIGYQPTTGRLIYRFCAMASRLLSEFLMLHNELKSQLLLSLANVMNPT